MERLTIAVTPFNRRQLRLVEREAEQAICFLEKVDLRFEKDLFESNLSYNRLYDIYSDEYDKSIDLLYERNHLKYLIPNTEYFKIKYKPKERPTTHHIMNKLNRFLRLNILSLDIRT